VTEAGYPLVFDEGIWSPNGTGLSDAARKANNPRLGQRMIGVLEVVNSLGITIPADVSELLDIDIDTAGRYLRRLTDSGLITRIERGRYSPKSLSACPFVE
jgi:DNA-binding transcriptional ArsR family regulator